MSTSSLVMERPLVLARAADYIELAKPKIAVLVLITVAAAHLLAASHSPDWIRLLHTLIGTLLVAASASALNHWLERERDALMPRTAQRPLPAGRLGTGEVAVWAAFSIIAGLVYLAVAVNLLTAVLGLATWVTYVWIYTPLKTRTPLNTAVGAVSGALPVLMGWTAAGQPIGLVAMSLFGVVFFWQFPHFMAIAWLYRKDYALADAKMSPVVDPSGKGAGRQAIWGTLALIPVAVLPFIVGKTGLVFIVAMLVIVLAQLAIAIAFAQARNDQTARRLLRSSLVSLPLIMGLIVSAPLSRPVAERQKSKQAEPALAQQINIQHADAGILSPES